MTIEIQNFFSQLKNIKKDTKLLINMTRLKSLFD